LTRHFLIPIISSFLFWDVRSQGMLLQHRHRMLGRIYGHCYYEPKCKDTVLPNVFYPLTANVGCIFAWEAILRISNNHPGFEPNVKPEYHGFGKMDEGFIGLNMSKVGGPKNEPFRPLWASFFVLFLVFLAIPYWRSSDNYDVDYIGGMPFWLVQTLLLSACASTISMLQCIFFNDDWTQDLRPRKMLNKKEPAESMMVVL